MGRIYINDVVDSCNTKTGHLVRAIIMGALVLIAAVLGMVIISEYQNNQNVIVNNTATKGQIQSEIDNVERERTKLQNERMQAEQNPEIVSDKYFYPKKYADELAKIQTDFHSERISHDGEIEAHIKKQMEVLNASTLINSTCTSFMYPWFNVNKFVYNWRCLTKIASVAAQTPVVWECIDENGYVLMVVTGKFDGVNTDFTDLKGFITYYGNEVMNGGNAVSSVNVTSSDIAKVNKDLDDRYLINMQPVADAMHDGKQFNSVDEIRSLAETKIQ